MLAAIENYKGIEFVRISSLPEVQQKMIWTSAYRHKVIKILRGEELLNDCLPSVNYVEWYMQCYKTATTVSTQPVEPKRVPKLVFK